MSSPTKIATMSTLDATLAYAARGWAVFPCRRDKKPLTAHGFKDASRDESVIRDWWGRWPDASIGIACGTPSGGLVVLDCDKAEFVWALENACGPLPSTLTVATGRGSHRYFVAPEPIQTRRLAPHLEIRGEGSYVIAPPSIHENGKQYRVVNNVEPVPLPAALLELLCRRMSNATSQESATGEKIRKGTRNSCLTSLAGTMRRCGMGRAGIEQALLVENAQRCEPPLPEAEVRKIAESVSRYRPAGAPSDTRQTWPLRSRGFRSWLGKRFFDEEGRAANGEALSSATTTLEGFARFESAERPVFVRVAGYGSHVFIDLCDEHWRAVEVDAEGYHIVASKDCPVRFRRAHGMQTLPLPEPGGSLQDLYRFLNVASESDFILLISWLVGTFHPSGPYPVFVLHGEQGSSKTTTARVLRGLVDPNLAPLRSEPREPRDLMVAANNGWICGFDNMSALPAWLSDAVCRLSTGGGFGARTLFTDQDETIFFAKRPTIITGIEELATRGDLLDRAIIVYLPRIPEQKCLSEEKLFKAYEAARPRLLGALFSAVSRALANCDSVTLDSLPRMADFALWVAAAEPALGLEPGSFLRAYRANRTTANELPLETPIVEAIRKVPLPWTGTASQLLSELETRIDERTKRSKSWPGSGRGLSNSLGG